jgi:hypothetical protein
MNYVTEVSSARGVRDLRTKSASSSAYTPRAWSWAYLGSVISRLVGPHSEPVKRNTLGGGLETWKRMWLRLAGIACCSTWLWPYKGMSVRYLARQSFAVRRARETLGGHSCGHERGSGLRCGSVAKWPDDLVLYILAGDLAAGRQSLGYVRKN